ncbi:MAG: helix-turn-helix transcriptional regulator [Algoriphagus sp.]|jgi:putative transcriptional regulator|nr:helix-turn-helix transcriptional regulator [Algoriphagus sp.]
MNNRIKIERAIHNLTQEQLAVLVSVTRQTINAIELKKFVPSTVLALKICKVFNRTVEEVFSLEEED